MTETGAWLDEGACWELLRGVELGRLAVVIDGRPEIFPVNHVVDHGTIVFRSAGGIKVDATIGHGAVAFEVDGYDVNKGEAWSVVVKGHGEEIRDVDEVVDASTLPLSPMQASPKHRFIRITPEKVTGRRFPVVDPAVWRNPFSLRRPSAME
jgi:nitroimidazol reductase NimA-like FMN-containing flavoprotein (pyridoxamine 5'-phosphate oxidase superfamily)